MERKVMEKKCEKWAMKGMDAIQLCFYCAKQVKSNKRFDRLLKRHDEKYRRLCLKKYGGTLNLRYEDLP